MLYRRLSFLLPPTAEEPLADRLWALGTLGLELHEADEERLRVDAWFAESTPLPSNGGADDWPGPEVELVSSATVAEEDWMAAYRRQARPIRVGRRLVVDPGDRPSPPAELAAGELWLHLPARRAFGTGSHESSHLVVELLDRLPLAGRTVLDLGAGSGLLAFVALARGARRVVAVDNDPVAALIAGQNRTLNRIWPAIAAGPIDCLGPSAEFDVALVNIRPRLVSGDLPALVARLRPGGDALFSGFLESERQSYEERLGKLGLEPLARRRRGEWAAIRARMVP